MSMATLQRLHALLPGSRLVGDGAIAVERVHSDTRSLRAGDFFVALRGERFDANDFLPQAKAGGAVAALAERGLEAAGLAGLEVADSGAALLALGGAWRAAHTLPLIAVTGSNGKTTVTQMIAAIQRAAVGDAAFATAGNLNNHIGLPLTLLRLRDSPTNSGHSSTRKLSSRASSSRLWARVLPKPKPGSMAIRFLSMPANWQARMRSARVEAASGSRPGNA